MVSSYTQLLARRYRGRLDEDADEFIGYAVDGAERMQRLINDLLTYSRVGTRGRDLAPTDLSTVLEVARTNLRIAIEESGAQITSGPLPTVRGTGRNSSNSSRTSSETRSSSAARRPRRSMSVPCGGTGGG